MHDRHVDTALAPVVALYVPAAHATIAALTAHQNPAGHVVRHDTAASPPPQVSPAGQDAHGTGAAPAAQTCPTAHATLHDAAAMPLEHMTPAGQLTQSACDAVADPAAQK